METWKAMVAASVVLFVYAVVVSVANIPLSGPSAIAVLAVAAIASGVLYVTSKWGFRTGKQIGEGMGDED
jgi:hypothetical protein